ncbi:MULTISPECIES: pyrimidine reductase family protein [Amycolatopsis]|jgi:riboflavin biosynthesis pyrimidine reductase|uniref:Pyrimidine reductase family protein n=1 Tax=Amycolatopsis nalaikhensis TaxID=715472 RepID=A0ABY8XLY8_9PSEU|nr:pyrimidine reductase family protein [Amycolatopsis sp. 2-2]WIV56631.1 pyrimidine reductase family protein [Amycolatopsis sp. 2-2]
MIGVRSVWPSSTGELTGTDLEEIYAYPAEPDRAWVQVNFVASADGAVEVDTTSAGLSHAADRRVFLLGRDLADVILVGAGTARAEDYRGVVAGPKRLERRRRLGFTGVPPIAVVTRTADLDPASRLFTETAVPPIVVTTERADTAALEAAGAEVLRAGETDVDVPRVLDLLAARGLRRIACEGGPRLFAQLVEADRVDQLCLTVAPMLVAGPASRIAAGPVAVPRRLALASILVEDGFTLLRYRRDAG